MVVAPFPSFGLGLPHHFSAAYAVGTMPPFSGCHLFTAHGAGTNPTPSSVLYLWEWVSNLHPVSAYKCFAEIDFIRDERFISKSSLS